MSIFQCLFRYVLSTTINKNIDESHAVAHAMDVLRNTHQIFLLEVKKHSILEKQEYVIYIAAVLHDMCDKKYMDEEDGIIELNKILYHNDIIKHVNEEDIDAIKNIIRTMSYSTVKENGFPDLGKYQHAYHIVREADLLAAYDFERAMIYHMYQKNKNIDEACINSIILFNHRIFQHENDGLLLTDYSKQQHPLLLSKAQQQIDHWQTLIQK